jgi:hypothetical protein
VIGCFYNGRDHSTVCYGIQRIEALRSSDPEVDALITDLKHELRVGDKSPSTEGRTGECPSSESLSRGDLKELADLIAARVCTHLEKRVVDMKGAADDVGCDA